MLEKGFEILDGPKVEGWKNATENYTFEPTESATKIIVDLDITQAYKDYLNTTWVKALEKLKGIYEKLGIENLYGNNNFINKYYIFLFWQNKGSLLKLLSVCFFNK